MSNEILKAAGHVLHECGDEECNVCPGGLAYCNICKRAESEFWDDSENVVECICDRRDPGNGPDETCPSHGS